MALELWILLGLVVAAIVVGAVARLHRNRASLPPQSGNNVYPLW